VTQTFHKYFLRTFIALFGVVALQFALSQSSFAATFPCTTSTLILSAQNGTVSNPNTWVGGIVPTDGNCVVIRHHVTLDETWGTDRGEGLGWVRIENNGILDSDCVAGHLVYFGSTGTDPIGSGNSENPGADADMFGFFVSYGTLNFSCQHNDAVSITTANHVNPWYIHHKLGDYVGCTSINGNVCNGSVANSGAVLTLKNTVAAHMGTDVLYFDGIDWDMTAGQSPTNALTISHSHISDLYQIAASGNVSQTGNWQITFNWFDTVRPNPSAGLIYSNGGTATGWNITDNTVTNSTTASYFLAAPADAINLQFMRNAVLGSSTTEFSLANITGASAGTNKTLEYNLCVNPEPEEATANPCISIGGGLTDSSNVSFNVIQGGHAGISQIGSSTTFTPNFGFNWISQWKEDYGAQGAITSRTGTVSETYNVLVMENSSADQYMVGDLAYTSGSGPCTASLHQDHNTIFGVSNGSGNPNLDIDYGDNTTSPETCIVNSYARSNISYGGDIGFLNRNDYNGWDLSQGIEYGGAAVHHNLTYNSDEAAYVNTQTSPGFDNGQIHHPSYSQYGDLTVDPEFLDSTRRPAGFDATCGGPGTDTSLFTNLAARSGFGTFNSCYSIPGLWTWMRLGWAPLNDQLVGAGHDGTYIGAVQPIGPGAGGGGVR
jgi:hypothetical protein